MTGTNLEKGRKQRRKTQAQTAKALGVSQPYLSLLESGRRPLTKRLRQKAVLFFGLSVTQVPLDESLYDPLPVSDKRLAADLASLGYPGFSHLKKAQAKNPVTVLLSALNTGNRDARLVDALPWVLLHFPDMDWPQLEKAAKANDLQNRLGFLTALARKTAERRGDVKTAALLKDREERLYDSRLANEGTLCNDPMTNAERRWILQNRPALARRWNLLTNLSPEHLDYYADR